MLSDHDDAWLRGRVEHDDPLVCPWFGVRCVHFDYRIERKVTRTSTDSKGRTTTTTSWQTEHSERASVPFRLSDDTGAIWVHGDRAEFHDLERTDTDYEGSRRRHSASLLREGATASVLGVKLEDASFDAYGKVPLLVTTKGPEAFVRRGDRSEWWLRAFGYFFVLVGFFGATALHTGATRGAPSWLLGAGIGVAALIPVWLVSTYNRFMRQRQQSEAAWRQIDIDLSVRDGVIPQVVAVVQGYAKHERELLERAASLRTGAPTRHERIAADRETTRVSRQLLALAERYPELEADALFADLHRKLWALEEKLAASRTFYNKIAKEWNDLVQGVPTVLVAKLFRFRTREFFAA